MSKARKYYKQKTLKQCTKALKQHTTDTSKRRGTTKSNNPLKKNPTSQQILLKMEDQNLKTA